MVIPNDEKLKHLIVREAHDNPLGAHFGTAKTSENVGRHYLWPGMKTQIRAYVTSCETRQTNKPVLQRKSGIARSLPIPKQPWGSVSMDLITQLPVN